MNTPNLSQESASPQNTPASLGTLLARARMARGLEPQEVAIRLGLNPQIIRSLEEGSAHQVDAPVFVRGYLLRYARFLGLPEQEILERYKHLGISEQPPLQLAPAAKSRTRSGTVIRWFSYVLVLGVIGWLIWLGFEQVNMPTGTPAIPAAPEPSANRAAPSVPSPAVERAGSAPAKRDGDNPLATAPVTGFAPPAAPPAQPQGSEGEQASGRQTVTVPPAPAPPVVSSTETQAATNTTPVTPTPALPPGQAELVLEFKGDCWVSVKDAKGQRLAYGTVKAATVNTLSGFPPFHIVLGNSNVVTIKLNGQTIEPATYVKRGGPSQFVLPKPGN
jgi:cytoskeleton protein RodZ